MGGASVIPKILHRIWWGPPQPEEFQAYGRAWQRLHPDWQLVEWTDPDDLPTMVNRALMRDAPAPDRHRYRADVARLEILYRMGGVYVDADIEPLRPIDPLMEGVECAVVWSANRGPDGEQVVSNAVIAAVPRHPFIAHAVATLNDSARRFAHAPTARAVGPWHLQRILATGLFPEVTTWPAGTFYPQSNADRDAGKVPDLSGAYGWHRWATSRGRRRA